MTAYDSRVPDLIDAMVDQFGGLFDPMYVSVSDGYDPSNDTRDKLMIGVDDPESIRPAPSADSTQDWPLATPTGRNEEGAVTLAAMAWDGAGVAKIARDRVYAIHAAVCSHVRESRTLGVPGVLWLNPASSTDLVQALDNQGAIALLTFRIQFKARI